MRPSSSTSREALVAALVAFAVVAAAAPASAQPCCGGANAFAPARLTLHEDALVGLSARAAGVTGSFDGRGAFVRSPAGTREIDLEQDVVGSLRVLTDGQVSFLVPVLETTRTVPGRTETSAGYGDLQLGARWDFTVAGRPGGWPGLAALGAVTLPTGVPPDRARAPLATDATGTGATEIALGASIEHVVGHVIVHATGTGAWHAARDVGSIHVQRGALFTALVGAGVYLPHDAMLALSLSYSSELATREAGAGVTGTERIFTRIGLGAGMPIAGPWRAQASFFADVPAAHLGKNQPTLLGGALLVVRGFS
jgi:hypothetical protein